MRVAFASSATISGAKTNSDGEVYVRDFVSGTTIWASSNTYAIRSSSRIQSFTPVISADGRWIVFKAASTTTNLYYHDLETATTTTISSNVPYAGFPEMTPDGRFVAYESGSNVFLWDRQSGSNLVVSVASNGVDPANGFSHTPVVTADGRKVAFLSDATTTGGGKSQLYVRDMASGTTRLVSANLDGKPSADLSGVVPAISPNGNWVVFDSVDDHLVPGDQNRDSDVFLRDLTADTTALVSTRLPNLTSQSGPGFFVLSREAVGTDGRLVVFAATASTLASADSSRLQRVFARDIVLGTNIPVNKLDTSGSSSASSFPTNATAGSPVMSANGRYVAYEQTVTTDSSATKQIYVRDLQSASNWLVSVRADGTGGATSNSSAPSISGDGRFVAFQSDAADLVVVDTNRSRDIFVRDLHRATNALVSVNLSGTAAGNRPSSDPVISRDGRWVVFQSTATDLVTNVFGGFALFARDWVSSSTLLLFGTIPSQGIPQGATINPSSEFVLFATSLKRVWLYDLRARSSTLVSTNGSRPAMSADGRFVAFETRLGTNQVTDIVLKDMQSGATNLISVNRLRAGGGNGSSFGPLISYDGRYIVFTSRASDLVDNDKNGWSDIFVRDRIMNTTILVSGNAQANGGNGLSSKPILGADGRTIVFQSNASDLLGNDFNDVRDLFILRLSADDSDHDGMDDDWELAYFGTLRGMAAEILMVMA